MYLILSENGSSYMILCLKFYLGGKMNGMSESKALIDQEGAVPQVG